MANTINISKTNYSVTIYFYFDAKVGNHERYVFIVIKSKKRFKWSLKAINFVSVRRLIKTSLKSVFYDMKKKKEIYFILFAAPHNNRLN